MLFINHQLSLDDSEIELDAMRAQGAGGQNVNKVSTAIHLRFDIRASSLPDFCKQTLLASRDSRITKEGVLVIKAQQFRTQEKNREDAKARLVEIIRKALVIKPPRKATRPTRASQKKRMDKKTIRGKVKSLRGKVSDQP